MNNRKNSIKVIKLYNSVWKFVFLNENGTASQQAV